MKQYLKSSLEDISLFDKVTFLTCGDVSIEFQSQGNTLHISFITPIHIHHPLD